MNGISNRSNSYIKTENNYTNTQKGKFNLNRIPEPSN